jgi:hypothetical protein
MAFLNPVFSIGPLQTWPHRECGTFDETLAATHASAKLADEGHIKKLTAKINQTVHSRFKAENTEIGGDDAIS